VTFLLVVVLEVDLPKEHHSRSQRDNSNERPR